MIIILIELEYGFKSLYGEVPMVFWEKSH